MESIIDNLVISYATEYDEAWLVSNDSNRYIAPGLVAEKIGRNEYIIAKVDGQPVGYLRLSYLWSFIPYIDIIAVDEPYQRQGIGKAMLGFLEELARRRGQALILSSSQADEPEPQAWHRHVGFKDAGALVDLAPIQGVTEILFVKRVGDDR